MDNDIGTWAILPAALRSIVERLSGQTKPPEHKAEEPQPIREAAGRGAKRKVAGSVVVIPIRGGIVPRKDTFAEYLEGISAERISGWIDDAVNDPNVVAIVLDIDSPGGMVAGIAELGAQIFEARDRKLIVAVANPLAASAAYWIGSAATELIVTPSGEAGSIGVVAMHLDWSVALVNAGIKATIVTAGRRKAEWNPYEPLDDEGRERLQALIDADYEKFVGAVAKQRGLTRKQVIAASNEARVLSAEEALAGKLIDRIADMRTVLAEFGVGSAQSDSGRRTRAALADLSLAEAEHNCGMLQNCCGACKGASLR